MIRLTIQLRLGLLMAVLFVSVPSGAVQQPVEGPATKAALVVAPISVNRFRLNFMVFA